MLSQTRTYIKRAKAAIESGDSVAAEAAVYKAVSLVDRAASKGVIHSKNAARRKSRLMKLLAAMEKETVEVE